MPRILRSVTTQTPHDPGRLEKILAYMVAGVVGLSILAFLAVILGTAAGAGDNDGFSTGVWPAVLTLPLFGLPLGFLLIIALMVVSGVRRAREARQKLE
ncbi:hypothetical protein RCH12_001533 [Cryobacterium sp. MP_3.1]|nr:hypothetical protein [Cryobacterium sp. MP_3.1]